MSESRRGNELAEMSAALRAHAAKANPTKDQQHARRALFQRIIQYLTIGIDMSPLFSDVIMNAHTKDMATKKMLYHYLTHYAQAKADLALLTVNTLQKDCRDEDPVVRGLAVRSMASMRVPDLVEYLVRSRLALARATKRRTGPAPHLSPRAATPPPPLGGKSDIARRARTGPKAVRRAPFFLLAKPVNPKTSLTFPSPIALSQIGAVQQGLQDAHPYPRKTAAMGVLKIYDLHPEAVRETELLQTLRRMLLSDQNAAAVFNCVVTLMEIDGPKSLATKQIVYGLINRLKDFTEWAQVTILEIVALYPPADKTETFDVMNALEDRLQHSNSAVVLATVKCFLRATLELPDVHQQVFERMKAPLLTLAQTESQEPAYAVWAHLHLLTLRAPPLFANEYKSFFCRVGDPPAVKRLKIEALVAVADVGNTFEIVTELSEYVSDVEPGIAREAVRGIARVALEGDCDAAGPIVRRLLQFVHHGAGYVVAETLAAVARLTRKHRQFANECVAAISSSAGAKTTTWEMPRIRKSSSLRAAGKEPMKKLVARRLGTLSSDGGTQLGALSADGRLLGGARPRSTCCPLPVVSSSARAGATRSAFSSLIRVATGTQMRFDSSSGGTTCRAGMSSKRAPFGATTSCTPRPARSFSSKCDVSRRFPACAASCAAASSPGAYGNAS